MDKYRLSHTVTSGNPSDKQTGTVFDSGLIKPSNTFSYTFKDPGTYHYFCMVHPWMTGEVIVGTSSASLTTNNAAAPEFGSITPLILSLSVAAIVLFSVKNRINLT